MLSLLFSHVIREKEEMEIFSSSSCSFYSFSGEMKMQIFGARLARNTLRVTHCLKNDMSLMSPIYITRFFYSQPQSKSINTHPPLFHTLLYMKRSYEFSPCIDNHHPSFISNAKLVKLKTPRA